MTSNPKLYDKIVLNSTLTDQDVPGTKTYKGFSTIHPDTNTFSLYDLALIKQDLLNHFHIRQGEMLHRPTFGTIIWDVLFEPMTEQMKQIIVDDVKKIINFDPRIVANNVYVSQYEHGLQIECELTYLPYHITEKLKLQFDENNSMMLK
jgi:phage baseplate assembly protein W